VVRPTIPASQRDAAPPSSVARSLHPRRTTPNPCPSQERSSESSRAPQPDCGARLWFRPRRDESQCDELNSDSAESSRHLT